MLTTKAKITKNQALRLGFGLWLALLAVGFSMLAIYGNKAGQSFPAEELWPKASQLTREPHQTNLVMFVHPWCPCSQASLTELEEILQRSQGRLAATVVFLKPEGATDREVMAPLWHHANSIPAVRVTIDREGREAEEFHAGVSGDTFVYTPEGRLAFHGGITAARGHMGDNAGQAAVEEVVSSGKTQTAVTPVFGCPLFTPAVGPTKGS